MVSQTDSAQSSQHVLLILVAVTTIHESVAQDCGGNYSALEGWITSPNYPDNYTNNMDCTYSITQPPGYRITLHFWDFHVSCASDFVQMYDGDSLSSPLLSTGKLCGAKLPPTQRTTGNALLIWFHSNENSTDNGFNISYVAAVIPKEFLLLASSGRIIRVDLKTMSYILVPVGGVFMAMAIDYDPVDDRIYWTDTALKEIRSAFLNGSDHKSVCYLGPGRTSGTLDGIRLDTQSRLIFYTDAGNQVIGLFTMTTFEQKLLITTDLDKPRAIVLDIINGIMFWTDWGTTPKIERANYDGTDRRMLVSTSIIQPDGLALDTAKNRLYWVDSGTDRLESMKTDGKDRIQLAVFKANPNYLGLALYNNQLYITHWAANGSTASNSYILRMYTNTTDKTIIEGQGERFTGIIMYSAIVGDAGPNGCTISKGGCSYICIPSSGNSTKCLSPIGQDLSDDQNTCLLPGSPPCMIYPVVGGAAGGGLALILLIIVIAVCVKKRRGMPSYDHPTPGQQNCKEIGGPYDTINKEFQNDESDRKSNIYSEIDHPHEETPECLSVENMVRLANDGYIHQTWNLHPSTKHFGVSTSFGYNADKQLPPADYDDAMEDGYLHPL